MMPAEQSGFPASRSDEFSAGATTGNDYTMQQNAPRTYEANSVAESTQPKRPNAESESTMMANPDARIRGLVSSDMF